MLKQQSKLLSHIAVILDICALVLSLVLAYELRDYQVARQLKPIQDYIWLLLVILPIWYFLLARFGLYNSLRVRSLWLLLKDLIKVQMRGAVILAAAIYLLTPHDFSRCFFLFIIVCSFVLLLLVKAAMKLVLWSIRKRGMNNRQLVIVGDGCRARRLVELIEEHRAWGLQVAGFFACNNETTVDENCLHGYPYLGKNSDQLLAYCRSHPVDEVLFCPHGADCKPDDELLSDLETIGVTTRIVLDLYESQRFSSELSFFHDELPMVTYCNKAFSADQLLLKRCLDIVGSLVGLLITAVLFPCVALAIKLEDPGPLFFGQTRVGLNRRTFKCWKFRSMFVDAEARKQELMAQNEMKGAMFKMKDDPRVTRVGRFIRKTSIDELPQFWNVLQGDMSLVGTRPPTPDEVASYENWHLRRVSIKPGITGLWQVSGRNQIQEFDEVVRLDLQYIDTWDIWQDLKILFRTVWVVFAGRGAR